MTVIPRTRLSKDGEEEAGPSSALMDLEDYLRKIEPTDRLPPAELRPVLMGLFERLAESWRLSRSACVNENRTRSMTKRSRRSSATRFGISLPCVVV